LAVAAHPLLSQRTCRIVSSGYDVKMAVDCTLTGERRLLFPINLSHAPSVSALVSSIVTLDGRGTLDVQRDVAAVAHADLKVGCHLGAIIRERLPRTPGESLVPAALLWSEAGFPKRLLALEDRHEAYATFEAYARLLLGRTVEFFVYHGVAFEPHLQNTLVRIRHKVPVGIVLRDLDSTLLDTPRFAASPRLSDVGLPARGLDHMPLFEIAGQRLLYALLTGHLSPVMGCLRRIAGADPQVLESIVASVWEELEASAQGHDRIRLQRLRASGAPVKRLLFNRLHRRMELSFTG
jgi:siderophore synthetase component